MEEIKKKLHYFPSLNHSKTNYWNSLVVQWLRICLVTQDTSSIPGRGGSHTLQGNQASTPQLLSLGSGAHEPQLLSPQAANMEARVPRAQAPHQEKPLQ